MFLLVANMPDLKGYIKIGNQRVIEARLIRCKIFLGERIGIKI